jgi:hypothetical protein
MIRVKLKILLAFLLQNCIALAHLSKSRRLGFVGSSNSQGRLFG